MTDISNYQRNSRSFYPSVASVTSAESAPIYVATREMRPPTLEFPPQPVEMDHLAHSINSRTLPSPGTSSTSSWDATQPHGYGDVSFCSSNANRAQQVPMESSQTRSNGLPLYSWYEENDGPWNPHDPRSQSHSKPTRHRIVSFAGQCRPSNPSDIGSTYPYGVSPSDSGYETRRSIANTSVLGGEPERDQDCHSLVGYGEQFQQFQGDELQQRDGKNTQSWTQESSQPSDSPRLVCPVCDKSAKTPSEMKKHSLRHTKPFHCSIPGCDRRLGFSTKNDLERHLSSKHPENICSKRYRCLVPGCKSKDKLWPRLDNFKSHLKRVHGTKLRKDSEFDEMVRRGECFDRSELDLDQELPPMRQLESDSPHVKDSPPGTGYSPSPWKKDVIEPSQTPLIVRDQPKYTFDAKSSSVVEVYPFPGGVQPVIVQPSEVFSRKSFPESKDTLDPLLSAPAGSSDSEKHLSGRSNISLHSVLNSNKAARQTQNEVSAADAAITEVIKTALASRIPPLKPTAKVQVQGSTNLTKGKFNSRTSRPSSSVRPIKLIHDISSTASTDSEILTEKKAAEVLNLLRESGYTISISKDGLSPRPVIFNPGSAASLKSELKVTCQVCKRFRGRPCELKKHSKRHMKPYGCTFESCRRTFGSKNDWKRHENSQHYHSETWRCSLPSIPSAEPASTLLEELPTCAKVYYRRISFFDHLKKSHADYTKVTDEQALNKKIDECRIGRNCQARFWCGFCEKLVDLNKKGLGAWNERFDHVDDHFMGKNGKKQQDIKEWTPIAGDEKIALERSSSESSPDVEAGASPSKAIVVEPDQPETSKKRRRISNGDEESRPSKQTRIAETVVHCCQCKMMHVPKLHTTCSNCDDSHKFCDNCERKVQYV